MASSFEKSVKGATKSKLAPPKDKYIHAILLATESGDAGIAEVFRTLQLRIRDSTWTIVFKSLIVVHLMMNDGAKDETLSYLSSSPKNYAFLDLDSQFAANIITIQTQGQNIRRYSKFLRARTAAFASTKVDYCQKDSKQKIKNVSIDKGLLRITRAIQDQIEAAVKCDFFAEEADNEIAVRAYSLVIKDLLQLYAAMNQAVMGVLNVYFELSRPDAESAVAVYQRFAQQTNKVVKFLSTARQYENVTRMEIPTIQHAAIGLGKSLEDYLNDKDFETNRRQYLATQSAKKGVRNGGSSSKGSSSNRSDKPLPPVSPTTAEAKGPAPDLIDFFESIEQRQETMAHTFDQNQNLGMVQSPMVTGMPPFQTGSISPGPNTNPFGQQMAPAIGPLQPQYTGAGFGGYGPQPPQQFIGANGLPQFIAPQQTGLLQMQSPMNQPQQLFPQSTNPFRQSTIPPMIMNGPIQPIQPQNTQGTNPFRINQSSLSAQVTGGFGQASLPQFAQASQIQPQQTGTNPFAKAQPEPQSINTQPTSSLLIPNVTGSTNPFRQSVFVNQQTGQGWQTQQKSMGGLEQFTTIPVFPRPGQ